MEGQILKATLTSIHCVWDRSMAARGHGLEQIKGFRPKKRKKKYCVVLTKKC